MLPVDQWLEIDRYALALTRELQVRCEGDYERYEFHRVVQALQTFCSEDLGGFYLDILKDRLYTTAPASVARRSAQSALWHILQAFTKLMAPVLSFTAEEIWQVLTGQADESIMLHTWHELPQQAGEAELLTRWTAIRAVRGEVTKALEDLRTEGKIGSALQASVEIQAAGEKYDLLAGLGDDLKFIFICSAAKVVRAEADGLKVEPLEHAKCERCWHVREDVGANAEHPTLCGRCVSNLHGAGEDRRHA